MSSVSHPSLPSSGYYSLTSLANSAERSLAQTHSTVGGRVKKSEIRDNESGNHSPIQIWDVKRDQLIYYSTGTNRHGYLLGDSYVPGSWLCYSKVKAVDDLFRGYYGLWPSNAKNHQMRVYINEPSFDSKPFRNQACWNMYTDSVHIGETDLSAFKSFAENQDIIAHEFGHGFVYYNSPIAAVFQSGALNESIADVIAIMTKHYQNKSQANDLSGNNWHIANGLLLNARAGTSLRSMDSPGTAHIDHPIFETDRQCDHMNRFRNADVVTCKNDSGFVHDNAGIPNKAFFLAASLIGGGSWERTGCIWLTALLNASYADEFSDFACHTMAAVKKLNYGENVYQFVGNAWRGVGVDIRKHGYRNRNSESRTVQQLNSSIHCFSQNMFYSGLNNFDAASRDTPIALNQVYENFWIIKRKPQNVDLRYGEYCFRRINGHQSTCSENAKAVEMYRDILREYETIDYLTPSQVSFGSRVSESAINALAYSGLSVLEATKSASRLTGFDLGFR